jgi:hypothetical protein
MVGPILQGSFFSGLPMETTHEFSPIFNREFLHTDKEALKYESKLRRRTAKTLGGDQM